MMKRLSRPRSCGIGMIAIGVLLMLFALFHSPTGLPAICFVAGGVLAIIGAPLTVGNPNADDREP